MVWSDLKRSFQHWRLIHLLGVSNLRTRYARSKLGQTWLTLSLLIQIAASGIVWSVLWHLSMREFLPYVAIGQTVYQFFCSILQDSTGIFVADSRLYMNQHLPFLTSILSCIYKNSIIFLHNIPIILLALAFSTHPIHGSLFWILILPLALVFLVCIAYFIACICTRYRDLVQVFTSLLNISFLVTPIIWKLSAIPEHLQRYFFLNPLTAFLEIIRNPLLGIPINDWAYGSVLGWTLIAWVMMTGMYYRFETRIILWI